MVACNEIVHQATRLRIMAALQALPHGEGIDFVRLRAIVDATDGNLGAHLATLEKADYVALDKLFSDRKPRTTVRMTDAGQQAYQDHIRFLRGIIEQ